MLPTITLAEDNQQLPASVSPNQPTEFNDIRTKDSPLRVVDLFAGAGGLSEGFRQAGYNIICGSDSDPDALATFRHNFPEAATICGDIREPQVRSEINAYAAESEVIIGGPPCQAFSQVRNHLRIIEDPRNSLYREFIHVIRRAKPLAFVMENVTGIDQMRVRDQIASDLELEGEYSVLPQVLDSSDFGVPQSRKRLIFIGLRSELSLRPPVFNRTFGSNIISLARNSKQGKADYSIVAHHDLFSSTALASLADPSDLRLTTASQALSDLETLKTGNRSDNEYYINLPEPKSEYQRLMRQGNKSVLTNLQVPRINKDTLLRLGEIPSGGNYRDLPDHFTLRYLTGHKWGQDNGSGKLSRRHFYAYRRLHPDIWAWTINTKADSVYHYKFNRALSVREFARIQSFPDCFQFITDSRKGPIPGRHDGGAAHSKYRQVGNAVPPLLAREIATRLLSVVSLSSSQHQAAYMYSHG